MSAMEKMTNTVKKSKSLLHEFLSKLRIFGRRGQTSDILFENI